VADLAKKGTAMDLPRPLVGAALAISLVSWAAPAGAQVLLSDSFESSPTPWGIFEEVVNGNACYATGIGAVDQTTEQAHQGSGSLRVWANEALSTKSDHVIGQRLLGSSGVSGRYRYDVWALIDPQAGDGLHEGQTGPEISLQNTRNGPSGYRTTTGGIQYVANKWSGQGTWNVWTDTGSGAAGWAPFATQVLTPGVWYELTLDVDYDANRYVAFTVAGGGLSLHFDLSSHVIVPESKFTAEAFWATLEGENAWSNCGQAAFEYRVYYDDAVVAKVAAPAAPASSPAASVLLALSLAAAAGAADRRDRARPCERRAPALD
jgi:hypothetical protein